ncbi:IS1380 family transposase [Microlunatus elymi]|uniref:IS1380 family transposase n=1 Tax=Microlunatus elymi TaxID=2596828 RepID=A0A516Q6I4_9ACTN|nr:IS1380 family transposase [Microlunatus elymi]QDP98661.1 IS1380 family transposase [Microlunatus elymi]QDP98791.1 IS1380 family transposase [Microlunatus elymi]QDP98924.1 IS1380 family transposase [Microlunatus elymi]
MSSSGALLLTETIRAAGLDRALSRALARWRADRYVHDPGKILLDVTVAVALGGDCLADVAAVRAQPEVFGPVASDPIISRLFTTLAADVDEVVTAIRSVHATARGRVWARRRPVSGPSGQRDGGQVIIDIDPTLVTAHSDKQGAGRTYKRGYGFHPICAFVDHGEHGTADTLAIDLRPGWASAMDSADHINTLDHALAQLPPGERDAVLVRTDSGPGNKDFLDHVIAAGLEYSVGFKASNRVAAAIETIPDQAWQPALDSNGDRREGAEVAELTRWMPPLTRGQDEWPAQMRVIARRERPHPGAQLRLTDHNGWRVTCFATNTRGPGWTIPVLEVRHRQRARCEDRIRALKDTGLRNLPFHGYNQNRIWVEIVALAADLLAWTQTLAFEPTADIRRWEPKRLRFRILAVAGRIIHTSRRHLLRLPRGWPWNHYIDHAWTSLSTA